MTLGLFALLLLKVFIIDTSTASPELPPRFLSPDIIIGNPNNPQSWNRYSYCLNNPVKYVDPDGLEVAFALKGTPGYMNQANRDKLRTELSQITGWSVNDIEIKNNILTVKPSAQATHAPTFPRD